MKSGLCIPLLLLALSACGPKTGGTAEADETSDSPVSVNPPSEQTITLAPPVQKEMGIEVATVALGSQAEPITATGQLTLNEDATWRVGAMTEGKIAAVLAKVGDSVRKGQVLANLHSHDVHISRAAYQHAKAELERRQLLETQLLRVRDRTRRLFDLKAASREQMEAAESEYQNARIQVRNAETEVEKARTHLTEILDVPLEKTVDGSGDNHAADLVPIKAPAAGIVMERLVTAGTVVAQGDPVFTVSNLSSLWMLAAVNEADLSRLELGRAALATVRAYPDEKFPGKILKLGEKLDPTTRTLQVRIAIPNLRHRLKPEMFATAEIGTPRRRAAIFVPEAAVQEVNGKKAVFLRTQQSRFRIRYVETAGARDGQIEITSGVQPGEEIVVKGGFILKSELLKGSE